MLVLSKHVAVIPEVLLRQIEIFSRLRPAQAGLEFRKILSRRLISRVPFHRRWVFGDRATLRYARPCGARNVSVAPFTARLAVP
jgi:hypothetical protein